MDKPVIRLSSKPSLTIATLILALFLLTTAINHQFNGANIENRNSKYYQVSSKIKKQITLGYDRTLAVLYWFDVISDFGGKTAQQADYRVLAKRLDTITTLNPYAEPSYLMASVLIPWGLQDTTLSRPLLQRAIDAMPHQWRWPFYYGFNRYWFDHDVAQAALYMSRAAALPNVSTGVIRVASKMQAEANNLDSAIIFLQQMLKNKQQDASVKDTLRQRILAIKTEKVLRNIDAALTTLPDWSGDTTQLPLIGIDLSQTLPDGGDIVFDDQHHPYSSKQHRRFKMFVPKHRQKELKDREQPD